MELLFLGTSSGTPTKTRNVTALALTVAPEGIEDWFRSTQALTQLHPPFEIEFVQTESLRGLRLGPWVVDAIELSHRVPSFAYSFTEAHVEPALDTCKRWSGTAFA